MKDLMRSYKFFKMAAMLFSERKKGLTVGMLVEMYFMHSFSKWNIIILVRHKEGLDIFLLFYLKK